MSRPYDFSPKTKQEAFQRQWNRCADCGDSLLDLEEHAHHVMPNQSGNPLLSSDDWIKSVDNCVILCHVCHYHAHNGNTKTGAVTQPHDFVYSHGPEQSMHQAWVMKMQQYLQHKGWK